MVAVSAAKPAWHDVRGGQTFTSIVRSPAQGGLWFGAGGPDGNETAVHTEAVLAAPAEHYDMWAERFGVDRAEWDWCRFGENIVVNGFDENSLRLGDIVRMGDVVFRVTSPRIPCFKFAWRLGQPDSVLGPMIESGQVGFYLAVETPGRIGAGTAATLESPDPAAMTVGDLSRLLVARDAAPEALREALANPWLGAQARRRAGCSPSASPGSRTRRGSRPAAGADGGRSALRCCARKRAMSPPSRSRRWAMLRSHRRLPGSSSPCASAMPTMRRFAAGRCRTTTTRRTITASP
ncbi:MOSC domain-containing protein [Sphingosinicella soli]|uniref:MOSC domain-containing protein YiiM n=1 Tax=Sphingosinicella soli TaxID=333708 RepID=A0A7W7F9W0_9SPHN|nr:MOSC domain-containing protein YiiM [Sphingosinicella soli]